MLYKINFFDFCFLIFKIYLKLGCLLKSKKHARTLNKARERERRGREREREREQYEMKDT